MKYVVLPAVSHRNMYRNVSYAIKAQIDQELAVALNVNLQDWNARWPVSLPIRDDANMLFDIIRRNL